MAEHSSVRFYVNWTKERVYIRETLQEAGLLAACARLPLKAAETQRSD
jgi:hypothetical protein